MRHGPASARAWSAAVAQDEEKRRKERGEGKDNEPERNGRGHEDGFKNDVFHGQLNVYRNSML